MKMCNDENNRNLSPIRYCLSCPADRPTILSVYNKTDNCFRCRERFQDQALRAAALASTRPKSRPVRGKCANCQREGMALFRSRYGKLCGYCHERVVGRDEENARRELMNACKTIQNLR